MSNSTKALYFILLFIATFISLFLLQIDFWSGAYGSVEFRAGFSASLALLATILVWIYSRRRPDTFVIHVMLGGLIIGSIGLLLGFVGPLILIPESNLGPLVGIFYTGPISFLLGLFAGGIYWKWKSVKLRSK